MKRLFFVLIVALAFAESLLAQNREIEISYEADRMGSYTFYCTNTDFCKYTVEITFSNMQNLYLPGSSPYVKEVPPGKSILLVLRPISEKLATNFSYSYLYHRGCMVTRPDTSAVYLLPVKPGKSVMPFLFSEFILNDKVKPNESFYSLGFKVNTGDTVCAARGGLVISSIDTVLHSYSNIQTSSRENKVEIMHRDCSIARYTVISNSLVQVGDKITAGDPIAIAGGANYTLGTHFRLSVQYNSGKVVEPQTNGNRMYKQYRWDYLTPRFFTKEQGITKLFPHQTIIAEHPESVITRELTRGEIKKRNKGK